MPCRNQKPYAQINPIMSLLDSVRAFASGSPSPEAQPPQNHSSQINSTTTVCIDTTYSDRDSQSLGPESNQTFSPLDEPKRSLLHNTMQQFQRREQESSQGQLEQTPLYQHETHNDRQRYQTPQEYKEEIDTAIDTYNPHAKDEYILQPSYLLLPPAKKRCREDRRSAPTLPSSPIKNKKHSCATIIPSTPPSATAKTPETQATRNSIEVSDKTWPIEEPRIISLLTDSSSSSRASSPADSDIIIIHATPIQHKLTSPPSNSSSISLPSSRYNTSSSSSSFSSSGDNDSDSEELMVTNSATRKRSSRTTSFPNPKRQQRSSHAQFKTGPWGKKDRMLLMRSLQRGVDFIALGQRMRRDVDDVFEKFSDVVAAGLYKRNTRDSGTQTDSVVE